MRSTMSRPYHTCTTSAITAMTTTAAPALLHHRVLASKRCARVRISSTGIRAASRGCCCQAFSISVSGVLSIALVLMELPDQHLLDAVHSCRHARSRETSDLRDRRGIELLEVQQ